MMMMSKDREKKVSMSLLSSLPDELVLSCIARLSRSDYAALSLVSKRYHSLVVSPDLYKMRSLMGRTEKRLYICLSTSDLNSTLDWFVLSSEKALIPIPSLPSQPPVRCSLVSLDGSIYAVGGWRPGNPNKALSDVMLLDCGTHTWHRLPSMRVARISPAVGVVDGKIYVIGGCGSSIDHSLCWGEVFDPKTQTWDNLVQLTDRTSDDFVMGSAVTDDKIYTMSTRGIVYYSPSESRWVKDVLKLENIYSYCFGTGKLLYCCNSYGNVFWSESDKIEWKQVKGLEAWPRSDYRSYQVIFHDKLTNFGTNIILIWFRKYITYKDIWCSEISFKRSEDKREVWGTVEWSQLLAANLDKFEVECSASVNL